MASSFEEGARICNVLGNKNIMMMGNHGVLVLGESIAETYDSLYYLERACKTLVLAYSTGRPLKILNPDAAENTAMGWEGFAEASQAHFREMKRILDRTEPSYAE
jgi:ribulose-5-phosphate 4-epimerase/fuculose-1-phosphate aldolase